MRLCYGFCLQYLDTSFSLLFQLLKDVTECETKVRFVVVTISCADVSIFDNFLFVYFVIKFEQYLFNYAA